MLYQTIITMTSDTIHFPDGTGPGFDRLSFSFPYEGRDWMIQQMIESGKMDRYLGEHDSVTHVGDTIVCKGPTWKTLEDAQAWIDFLGQKIGIISTEITEISE
jgi:hypothetical protein